MKLKSLIGRLRLFRKLRRTKALSILFRSLIVKSLILAQDERWRRG